MKFIIIISGPSIALDSNGKMVPASCLKARLDRGLDLWKELSPQYPDLFIIMSGADGDGSRPMPSSTIMKEYFVTRGVPDFRILEDPNAQSTVDNAINTTKLMDNCELNGGLMQVAPKISQNDGYSHTYERCGSVTNIWLVTSEFHIERSKAIYRFFLSKTFKKNVVDCVKYVPSPNAVDGTILAEKLDNEQKALASFLKWTKSN